MRVLCLFFPRLGLQLALRQRPALEGRTLVLLQGHGEDALVTAATADASGRGLLAGMTAAEARRRVPDARFLPDNAGDCLDELERVADIIRRRATPLVEIGGREHIFVDVTAVADDGDEGALAGTLGRLASSWSGLTVRAGVASGRAEALDAARVARLGANVSSSVIASPEAPIAPYREEVVGATVDAVPGSDIALPVQRLLRRLDIVLTAREASVREVRIVIERPGTAIEQRLRLRQPAASTAAVRAALFDDPSPLRDATAVRIELRRLGPDVRVRPCIASAAHRGEVRRIDRRRRLLLRAG